MNLKNYLKETEGPSLEVFKKLVERHDLTYSYSDDFRSYSRGEASAKEIMTMKEKLIKEDPANEEKINKIWNDNIDKNFTEAERKNWYWGVK